MLGSESGKNPASKRLGKRRSTLSDSRLTKMQKTQLDIPIALLVKLTLYGLAIFIIAKSVGILLMVYVSLILASALRPIVNFAKYFNIPKVISIMVSYLLIIGIFAALLSTIIPPILTETNRFVRSLPGLANELASRYSWLSDYIDSSGFQNMIRSLTDTLSSGVSSISSGVLTNALTITFGVFGAVIGVFLIFMMTFYILVGENTLVQNLANIFPINQRKNIPPLIYAIQSKLGAWLRGQLSLMLIVGGFYYIAFLIIGAPYALPLAVIGGILELVPYIGPNVTGVIAFLVLLPSSPVLAVASIVVVFVVQQLENAVFVPIVMKQAVGLDPLFVIISLSVGSQIFGFLGAVLAVPMVVTLAIVAQFYQQYEKEKDRYDERQASRKAEAESERSRPDFMREVLKRLSLKPRA